MTNLGNGIYTELTQRQVERVKRASKHASNNPHFWRSVVARPKTAIDFCERVERDFVQSLKNDPSYVDADND